jgi:hypothetical protein
MSNTEPEAASLVDYAVVLALVVVPVLALLWAMQPENPYSYFVFLRVVICFCAGVFAVIFSGMKRETTVYVFVAVMVLYNPIFPVHLDRARWLVFNAATIAVFLFGTASWWAELRRRRRNDA